MKKYFAALGMLFLAACAEQEQRRPNILLIVADDLGYSDIGAFGGEISTPNLDQLASDGIRMSNFYAATSCAPTRSMLFGGVDNHKAGLGGRLPEGLTGKPGYEGYLNFDVVSVANLIKDAGYHTYMTGKWHLGLEENQGPQARGFEKSFALLQGGASHFDDGTILKNYPKATYREDGKITGLPDDFFSSKFFTDKLINYLKSNEGDDKPFFGYLAYTAPHWPLQAPEDYIDKYKGQYDDGYMVLREKRVRSMQEIGLVGKDVKVLPPTFSEEEYWENIDQETKLRRARQMEIYAAMVDNMDYHIGRLFGYLKDSKQWENTIVFFISDNGAPGSHPGLLPSVTYEWIEENFDLSYENMGKPNSYVHYGLHWGGASTVPYRLFKAYTAEGGIKVPAIVHFKEQNLEFVGKFSDQMMTVVDLAPTFLEIAGAKHPGETYHGRKVHAYQGTSAMPYLRGMRNFIHDENYAMGWEAAGRPALRKGHWKIVAIQSPNGTGEFELFNLENDPGETDNLRDQYPIKFAELHDLWLEYMIENDVVGGAGL
ncbi:MAG: arylsulfatase [Emcibacteraceae bacterium]|nr:arylsulfatase [Emcibacteraceae bacterium]MDG1858599.1 arylsulfatase [Emcibacteraceae bacterium]